MSSLFTSPFHAHHKIKTQTQQSDSGRGGDGEDKAKEDGLSRDGLRSRGFLMISRRSLAYEAAPTARVAAHYDSSTDTFTGTMALMTKVAMSAVMRLGWKLTAANEAIGLVTFETRMSFGSWSGVSCSLSIEEVAPNRVRVSGSGKQNARGGQLGPIDFFGEAKSKVDKAIAKMKDIAR